ncbi:hypothetical protein YYC_04417 [Plasmodium yoelii 17X]|uniref:Ubiquitin-related modifier 1 homolog n=1 Tax=Plasmodium yoelii 17X TaxID=1323249 RepID=V7PEW4_PLAYE|nr:hypothetical protein YYC_04417 [Plasmodium yoelii 17X]
MKVKIELKFLGGLESYLEDKSKNYVTLEIDSKELNFENLIAFIRDNIIEKKFVFSDYDIVSADEKLCKVLVDNKEYSNYNLKDKAKIKPGIIVLVNEYDWEILGTYSYQIKNDDKICFLSTLHGVINIEKLTSIFKCYCLQSKIWTFTFIILYKLYFEFEQKLEQTKKSLRSSGAAPLIYNPIKKLLIILALLYICLSALSCGIFLFPKASDLHCSPLVDSLFNFYLSMGASNVMAPYYSMISCREWGTENEWVVVAIVSAVMAIIDVSSSFYANAFLVVLHFIVAITSIVVYYMLMKNIDKQLEDNRNII